MFRTILILIGLQSGWAAANIVSNVPLVPSEMDRYRKILTDSRESEKLSVDNRRHMREVLLIGALKQALPKTFNWQLPANDRRKVAFVKAATWICEQPVSIFRLRGVETLIQDIFARPYESFASSPPQANKYSCGKDLECDSEAEVLEEQRHWDDLVRALLDLRRELPLGAEDAAFDPELS